MLTSDFHAVVYYYYYYYVKKYLNILNCLQLQDVKLVVDRCKDSPTPPETGSHDLSLCEASGVTPGENMFLNVNTPLQLGGISNYEDSAYPQIAHKTGFEGCVKNVLQDGRVCVQFVLKLNVMVNKVT